MNIPDEYWTDEVPTEAGVYAYRHKNSTRGVDVCRIIRVQIADGKIFHVFEAGFNELSIQHLDHYTGIQWCRLAPAAELDRLKAENEKLREWIKDAYVEGAAAGHYKGRHSFHDSRANARLEGGVE